MVYKKINYIKEGKILIYKPTPCLVEKIQNQYRWQITLKCKLTSKILDIIEYGISDNDKNNSVKIYVDIV